MKVITFKYADFKSRFEYLKEIFDILAFLFNFSLLEFIAINYESSFI